MIGLMCAKGPVFRGKKVFVLNCGSRRGALSMWPTGVNLKFSLNTLVGDPYLNGSRVSSEQALFGFCCSSKVPELQLTAST